MNLLRGQVITTITLYVYTASKISIDAINSESENCIANELT
jgi:hypothetical protein